MKFKFTALVFMLTFVQTTLANTAEVAVQHFPNPSTMSQALQPLVSGDLPPFGMIILKLMPNGINGSIRLLPKH